MCLKTRRVTKRDVLVLATLRYATGWKTRHNEVNKLIKLALDQAKFPSTLEPIGLSRKGDRRRPEAEALLE